MSKHPEVLWAQRSSPATAEKNTIMLTVNLPDIIETTLEYKLTSTSLSFKATTSVEKIQYAFDLDFFEEIEPEQSTRRLTSRSLTATLRKKQAKSEYWPRLTKEKSKTPFIKTDFSKWVDEDEQDGNPSFDDDFGGGMPGMDDGMGMGGMGGIPGMENFDFSKMSGGFDGGVGSALSETKEDAEDDSEDEGPPPLEEVETAA